MPTDDHRGQHTGTLGSYVGPTPPQPAAYSNGILMVRSALRAYPISCARQSRNPTIALSNFWLLRKKARYSPEPNLLGASPATRAGDCHGLVLP